MNEHFEYDELYGTLLHKNDDDTEREYFIIECQFYKFYRWMFQYGWNLIRGKPCERNGIKGVNVLIHKGGHK